MDIIVSRTAPVPANNLITLVCTGWVTSRVSARQGGRLGVPIRTIGVNDGFWSVQRCRKGRIPECAIDGYTRPAECRRRPPPPPLSLANTPWRRCYNDLYKIAHGFDGVP
ncbi:hypothetical protein MTP99_015039 [Tenebrio molitor]|nr:hypothetical protein MTP99_015039 [Tenebrio molitor]